MKYRTFGRTGWKVSELGYGMWGLAEWSGFDDEESLRSLQLAVDNGCNFFDTAWAYGEGHSEKLLGQIVRANPDKKVYVATKVPPKHRLWPWRLCDTSHYFFPPSYVRYSAVRTLTNLGMSRVDLFQFYGWATVWTDDKRWQRVVSEHKREGLTPAIAISISRRQPLTEIRALRT